MLVILVCFSRLHEAHHQPLVEFDAAHMLQQSLAKVTHQHSRQKRKAAPCQTLLNTAFSSRAVVQLGGGYQLTVDFEMSRDSVRQMHGDAKRMMRKPVGLLRR